MRQPVQKQRNHPSFSRLAYRRNDGLPDLCILIGQGLNQSRKRVDPSLTNQRTSRGLPHLTYGRLKRIKEVPSRRGILIQLVEHLRRRQSHQWNWVAKSGDKGSRPRLRRTLRQIQIAERPGAPLSHPVVVIL